MRVRLLLTCLCDAFYGEVGIASVRILEHVGCEVEFPESQTCCGQPPYNAGDWHAARSVAERCARVFAGDTPVVTPSASCAAMVRHGYPSMGSATVQNVFELSQFIQKVKPTARWPDLPRPRKVAFHHACHGRMIGLRDTQQRILANVKNLELLEPKQAEQCCGFGGAFSATHGKISQGIGLEKLARLRETGADTIVSGDMGCLMHLNGLISREGLPLQTMHWAPLLAEGLSP